MISAMLSDRGTVRRVILLVLVALLAVLVAFVAETRSQAVWSFRYLVYWFLCILVGVWGWSAWRVARGADWSELWGGRRPRRTAWWMIGVVVFTAWLVCAHQKTGLRVVNDETLLMSTAKSMFDYHEAAVAVRGYDLSNGYEPMGTLVDKRPGLFPWIVAMVHTVTGYRFDNAFYVNRVLSVLLALVLFLAGKRLAGSEWGGALLSALVMSPPMMAVMGNGGGFEILNVLMIAVAWHAGMLLAERPDDPDRLSYLVLTGVLLTQLRYESIVFVAPVGLVVLYSWFQSGRIQLPWRVIWAPLFVIPWGWQHRLFDNKGTWQLEGKPEATSPFGFQYFYDNVGHAMSYYLSLDSLKLNSIPLFVLGVGAAGFWVLLFYRRYRKIWAERSAWMVHYIFWAALLGHLVLMMLYFWGQFDDALTTRLAMPSHILLALSFVGVLASKQTPLRVWQGSLALILGFIVLSTVPQLSLDRYNQGNESARAQEFMLEFARKHRGDSLLVIDNFGGLIWSSNDISCVATGALQTFPDRIRWHWKRHTFSEIWFWQRMEYNGLLDAWVPFEPDQLGPDFDLETIAERRLSPSFVMRLSRITAIRDDHMGWHPVPDHSIRNPGDTRPDESQVNHLVNWGAKLP